MIFVYISLKLNLVLYVCVYKSFSGGILVFLGYYQVSMYRHFQPFFSPQIPYILNYTFHKTNF